MNSPLAKSSDPSIFSGDFHPRLSTKRSRIPCSWSWLIYPSSRDFRTAPIFSDGKQPGAGTFGPRLSDRADILRLYGGKSGGGGGETLFPPIPRKTAKHQLRKLNEPLSVSPLHHTVVLETQPMRLLQWTDMDPDPTLLARTSNVEVRQTQPPFESLCASLSSVRLVYHLEDPF